MFKRLTTVMAGLGLACALVHSPNVLLLDEPTDGVDPVGRREIRDLLRDEARNGTAILLNSHLLSEIELTCDRVAVLRKGEVAASGTIDELTKKSPRFKMIATPVDESLLAGFRSTGAAVERVNGHLLLSVTDAEHLNALIDRTRAAGSLLIEVSPVRSTLEDVFVDLIKATGDSEVGGADEGPAHRAGLPVMAPAELPNPGNIASAQNPGDER